MKIKDTKLVDDVEDILISDHGIYYFFEEFIVAEITEGYIYNWESAQEVIEAAIIHYGEDLPISYITNRVNNYSVKPTDWLKFFKGNYNLNGYAIVTYTETGWFNAILEKLFFPSNFERFTNLLEAINWVKQRNNQINLSKEAI